jgi:hypothetical protein
MTAAMRVQGTCLQEFLAALVMVAGAAPSVGQALYVDRVGGGTVLVVVAEPLADATTVTWPTPSSEDGAPAVVTSGNLTLVTDLELILGGDQTAPAPPVIVAAGGVAVSDLRTLFGRLLAGRAPAALRPTQFEPVIDGGFERRLGAPGSEAEIRLEADLPPPQDPTRSSVEVLWDVLPELLVNDLEGVRSRIDGNRAVLEARTGADAADLAIRRLRLGLAKIAEAPGIQDQKVAASARRLQVRRQAMLEEHPAGSELLLDLWIQGRENAVREYLFGVDGVTTETVRSAARVWLPQHPGMVVVTLPPTAFNPRFASPPEMIQLDNGFGAAILERSGAPLATMCLRPVVVPDLDEELAATVLSRVARELREGEQRPGWVRVTAWPPQIEMAAPADQFGELSEALRSAVAAVALDDAPVASGGGSPRQRALRLMAGALGVAEGSNLSPSSLMRTGNLALGAVAEDRESASEAIRKFWTGEDAREHGATVRAVAPVPKTREAAAGGESVLVVALELAAVSDEPLALIVRGVLAGRGDALVPEGEVEILQPFIPGHRVILVVASAATPLDALEKRLRNGWAAFLRPTTEQEVTVVARRVAAAAAAEWSGTTGRARRCAAVAAGVVRWRMASELEMSTLSLPVEMIDTTLASLSDWSSLQNTGAGLLPIVDLEKP